MLDLKEFEGLNTYDVNGYIAYYLPKHHLANKSGKVYQHMIAAEQMLGRKLKPEEVVHHEDRNKHNNSFGNLMVFKTGADHAAYHQGCKVKRDGDVYVAIRRSRKSITGKKNPVNTCPLCGNEKHVNAIMCIDCRNKENAKNIPSKDELYNLLPNNSICAIGRMYNVSDNAVRKWCKKYELPINKKDIEKEFGIIKEAKEKHEPTPCKPVEMFDIETGKSLKIFHSVYEAGVYIGSKNKRQHIVDVCNGNRKTAYGYKWRWYNVIEQDVAF